MCVITLPAWSWPVSCLPLPWEKLEGQTVSLPSASVTFFSLFLQIIILVGRKSVQSPPPSTPPHPLPLSLQTYCLTTAVVSTRKLKEEAFLGRERLFSRAQQQRTREKVEQPIRRLGLQTAPLTSCLGLKEAADDAAPKTRTANTKRLHVCRVCVCTEHPPPAQPA